MYFYCYIYVFLLTCMLWSVYSLPTGILLLPWLRFFRAFFSVVRQIPGYTSQRRRRSAAARLLRSWVWIPPGAWMFVCCECCVLSGRGLCDELITRTEESYRLWCVVVCDLETSRMRRPQAALGRSAKGGSVKKASSVLRITSYICRK